MLNKEIQLKNGQTCILRQPQVEDAQKILDYMKIATAETDFLSFGKGELTWTLEEEQNFIKEHRDDNNKLIILAEVSNKIIGMSSITGGKPKRVQHSGELGITILSKYWSLGIGNAFMENLIQWANNSGVIRKIFLKVRTDNKRAIKLYKKFGFVKEGKISRQLLIDNKFYDAYLMGLNID
ncbi:MAG: GNAT family N-acetyltransferase [Sedimentisphaerales bacterium]|nr:GNAT family N-acetyltransferase [Sedimentisphaerales bacterium]